MTRAERAIGAIVLHPADDVAVLTRAAQKGEIIATSTPEGPRDIEIRQSIPGGHKVALRSLESGAHVRKHGEVIGELVADVAPGDHVHVHNLASLRAR